MKMLKRTLWTSILLASFLSLQAHAEPVLETRLTAAQGADGLAAVAADGAISDAALAKLAVDAVSWEVRLQAQLVKAWRMDAAALAEIFQLMPLRTKAGSLRFVGPWRSAPEAWPVYLHRLRFGGEDAPVRVALIEALSIAEAPLVVDGLLALLATEEEAQVRAWVVVALGRNQDVRALSGIAAALDDAAPGVRSAAVAALGEHPAGASLQSALPAALGDDDAGVRAEAARVMGWLEMSDQTSRLQDALGDASPDVREQALRALARVAPAQARTLAKSPALRNDPDPRVARTAAMLAGD